MNKIIVIRISDTPGQNQKLGKALDGNYGGQSQMVPVIGGGMVSTLITLKTFAEMVKIVRDAECGDSVIVVNCDSLVLESETVHTMTPTKAGELGEPGKTQLINEFLEIRKTRSLTESETEILERLLNS